MTNAAHHTSNPSLAPYYSEISGTALLTRDEERDLGHRIQSGDAQARERMIESNLRLVAKIAQDFVHRGLPMEDLIAEGNIGLMKAADRYDPDNGAKFSTYAAWWIKQHMRTAISNQVRTVRLPTHIQSRAWHLEKESVNLHAELGREPTTEELADALELSLEQVRLVRRSVQPITPLDAPIGNDEKTRTIGEIIPDDSAVMPDEATTHRDEIDQALQLLDDLEELTDREKIIIKARFGIDDDEPATLGAVGERVGLTRERVRQIQNMALTKLRIAIEDSESFLLTA